MSYKAPAPLSRNGKPVRDEARSGGESRELPESGVAVSAATDWRFSFFLLFLCCCLALVAIYGSGFGNFRVRVKIFSIFFAGPCGMPTGTVTAAGDRNVGQAEKFSGVRRRVRGWRHFCRCFWNPIDRAVTVMWKADKVRACRVEYPEGAFHQRSMKEVTAAGRDRRLACRAELPAWS